MIPRYFFTLLVVTLLAVIGHSQTQVMTFNIRYDNANDGENRWDARQSEVTHMLQYYHPDFIGVQEAMHHQMQYIDDQLTEYDYIGVGRDDGREKGEYSAIFYDAMKYEVLHSRTWWLSDNPNEVSIGWDASMERITTYGAFRDRISGDTLHVFNAHFDHIGEEARIKSAELILKLIEDLQITEKSIIVMGDFNSTPFDRPISIFKEELSDSYDATILPPYGPVGTWNGFDENLLPDRRIDYVFVKNMKVLSYRNIDDKRSNGLCTSDHLAVLVTVRKE